MKKENLLIYAGSAIFFVLVISLGFFMYKAIDEQSKVGENTEIKQQEQIEETENASTEIGKTVEEQENETKASTNTNTNTSKTTTELKVEKNNTEANSKPVEKNEEKTVEKENPVTETKVEITFIKPVEGEIICEYAKDNLIYSETLKEWVTHTAIDIKADKTSIVKASTDGIVKSIVNDPRYGLTVVMEHADGYKTIYSNLLTAEFVVEGEEVKQDQTIGTVGNTAAFESSMETHLHFEIMKDGEYVDPKIYLK